MSKFKSSLETENEIASGPLTFSKLEILLECLLSETLELQQDFSRKAEFANERFLQTCKNELEIEKLWHLILKLQQELSIAETELQAMEPLFQQIKSIAQTPEMNINSCLKNRCDCGSCYPCCCKTERQIFMEMLLNTNGKLAGEVPDLLEGMQELATYMKQQSPYTDIIAILYCHYEILAYTEKNINSILDKLSQIELEQLSLKTPMRTDNK